MDEESIGPRPVLQGEDADPGHQGDREAQREEELGAIVGEPATQEAKTLQGTTRPIAASRNQVLPPSRIVSQAR